MSGYINVVSRTQHIIVDPGSSAIAVINAGPPRSGDSGGSGGSDGIVITLPPPLTSGSPLQAFTDSTGEAWIAKGDVNGGKWKRARDAIHCRVCRSAVWSIPVNPPVPLPWDTINNDLFGLYVLASNSFVIPVSGVYRVTIKMAPSGGVSAYYWQMSIAVNGGARDTNYGQFGSSPNGMDDLMTGSIVCNAGDLVTTLTRGSTAACSIPIGTSDRNFAELDYLGTG
jgi:hypothetical protein